MPACVAWIVQVPIARRVTSEPETVQTDGVSETKLTGRPEVADAVTAKGGAPYCWFARVPKLIVWLVRSETQASKIDDSNATV